MMVMGLFFHERKITSRRVPSCFSSKQPSVTLTNQHILAALSFSVDSARPNVPEKKFPDASSLFAILPHSQLSTGKVRSIEGKGSKPGGQTFLPFVVSPWYILVGREERFLLV
jgi:hypothetical protein